VSFRVLRFAVVSSVLLGAAQALAQQPTADATESAANVTPPRLIRAESAIVPDGEVLASAVSVTLALTVDESGRVSEATISESGGERFDQSALAAVKQFEFEPARRAGEAVAAKIRYRYVFPAQAPSPAPVPAAEPPPANAPAPPTASAAQPQKPPAPSEPEEFSALATVEAPPREPTRRSVSG